MATRIYTQGQLKEKLQFQKRAAGESGLGEANGEWVNDGDPRWAAVFPVRGAEVMAAGGQQRTFDVLFVIRHSASRTADHIEDGLRILHDGKPFDVIAAVRVDAGLDCIEIQAIRGARDGRQL